MLLLPLLMFVVVVIVLLLKPRVETLIGGTRVKRTVGLPIVNFGACGGILIHPRAVLTAAHCSKFTKLAFVSSKQNGKWPSMKEINDVYETEGEEGLKKFMEQYTHVHEIEKVINHPRFGEKDKSTIYDIAVVILKDPSTIKPALLPSFHISKLDPKMSFTMWGAGFTKPYDALKVPIADAIKMFGHTAHLKSAQVKFTPKKMCLDTALKRGDAKLGHILSIKHPTTFCIVTPQNLSGCNMDSGSALTHTLNTPNGAETTWSYQ